MSTQELMELCERLPEAQRKELENFARSLLAQSSSNTARRQSAQRWLSTARGAALAGTRTDAVMALTRGEP